MATSWVTGNRYLSHPEMENNAQMFYYRMTSYGFGLNAICGMLGNLQTESGINPGIWESLDPYVGGYGLVQWTPYTKYSEWAGSGWQDNGDKECERINYEFANGIQYYPTESFPLTAEQFKTSNATPEVLAETFLHNYERPASYDSAQLRKEQARYWYTYLSGTVAYQPRLQMGDIYTSPYYTTYDAYWTPGDTAELNMPNCTCYAFGRWNELARVTERNSRWPTGAGGQWYAQGVAKGFDHGMVPRLGAAASWYYEDPEEGVTGHVSIVEQINYDANGNPTDFWTSNSDFYRGEDWDTPQPRQPWFYMWHVYMNNLDSTYGAGTFNGFIYHPDIAPPTPSPTGRKMPFIFYLKRIL